MTKRNNVPNYSTSHFNTLFKQSYYKKSKKSYLTTMLEKKQDKVMKTRKAKKLKKKLEEARKYTKSKKFFDALGSL